PARWARLLNRQTEREVREHLLVRSPRRRQVRQANIGLNDRRPGWDVQTHLGDENEMPARIGQECVPRFESPHGSGDTGTRGNVGDDLFLLSPSVDPLERDGSEGNLPELI